MTNGIEVKSKVEGGLRALSLTLDGNGEKISFMVNAFIQETPGHFSLLRQVIETQNRKEVQEHLHKLKARYGYFGLTDLMNEMDNWEIALGEPIDHKINLDRLAYFEKLNTEIMTILKQTDYLKGQQTESVDLLPLQGKCVLVAEDDEINAMVFNLFIEELGGQVIQAADGHEAVRRVMEHSPDFIFMDIHMPYFSGIEAIKLLRSKNVSIPIIALSASTRLQEKQQSLDAGATDFLTKPAKRDVIREMLLKHLC